MFNGFKSLALVAAAVVLYPLFVVVQRVVRTPLIRPGLLARRPGAYW